MCKQDYTMLKKEREKDQTYLRWELPLCLHCHRSAHHTGPHTSYRQFSLACSQLGDFSRSILSLQQKQGTAGENGAWCCRVCSGLPLPEVNRARSPLPHSHSIAPERYSAHSLTGPSLPALPVSSFSGHTQEWTEQVIN